MPESRATGAVDPIWRQLRRVRRSRNLVEVQRALYLLIAAAAGAAALLVPLALAGSTALFAVALWAVLAALATTACLLGVELRRRWVGAGEAAAWIDRRAGLRSRLATLAALAARPPRSGEAFFLPLLVDDNLRRLPLWRRERLVPRRVPLGALAVALATLGLLLLALAPSFRPAPVEIVFSDEPVEGAESEASDAGLPARIIVAPAPAEESARERGRDGAAAGAADAPDSALAELSAEVQERIRQQLWGEAWERMRESMMRADRERREDGGDHGDRGGGEALGTEEEDWETAALAGDRDATPRSRRSGAAHGFSSRDGGDADDAEAGDADEDAGAPASRGGEQAAGAGNDSDPAHLFGDATDPSAGAAAETFEVGIAAPVRARPGGRRAGDGPPPAAEPDGRPILADPDRAEHATPRMAVPAAYETIVRQVFAHRAAEERALR